MSIETVFVSKFKLQRSGMFSLKTPGEWCSAAVLRSVIFASSGKSRLLTPTFAFARVAPCSVRPENQFSFTRAALSTGWHAKWKFLSAKVMTSCHYNSRREFLRKSFVGGAAALAAWRLPSVPGAETPAAAAPALPAAGKPASRVALTAGNDRANLAFKALEPFQKEIAAAIGTKRVVIKPNNVYINNPLCATDANHLEGILEFLKSIGQKNIVIAESAGAGNTMEGFANYGYNKFVGKYGVQLMDLDKDQTEVLYCIDENDFHPHRCRIARTMLDPNNFIISSAKFKTHNRVGVTLSLKNIVVGAPIKGPGGEGSLGTDKPLMHGGGMHGANYNLFTMASRLHPHLAVIDGYEGMEGKGPTDGTPVDHKVCVASLDWLAADRVATELMGIDFGHIGYLTYCTQSGTLGQGDLSKIEIVGPAIKDHVKKYQLPPAWDSQSSWQDPIKKA
jgi:uncharacterized protein (DUF362 family)